MPQTQPNASRDAERSFVRRYGVIWWGLPTGITTAILSHGYRQGYSYDSFMSATFFINLVACILAFTGGGVLFGRYMWRHVQSHGNDT